MGKTIFWTHQKCHPKSKTICEKSMSQTVYFCYMLEIQPVPQKMPPAGYEAWPASESVGDLIPIWSVPGMAGSIQQPIYLLYMEICVHILHIQIYNIYIYMCVCVRVSFILSDDHPTTLPGLRLNSIAPNSKFRKHVPNIL